MAKSGSTHSMKKTPPPRGTSPATSESAIGKELQAGTNSGSRSDNEGEAGAASGSATNNPSTQALSVAPPRMQKVGLKGKMVALGQSLLSTVTFGGLQFKPPAIKNETITQLLTRLMSNTDYDPYLIKIQTQMMHQLNNFAPSKFLDTGMITKNTFDEKILVDLLANLQKIILSEDTVMRVSGDAIVASDVHGKVLDMIRVFREFGFPSDRLYVFLGDYLDRGPYGLETFIFLAELKVQYPKNVILLRGNHEDEVMNKSSGFQLECINLFCSRF